MTRIRGTSSIRHHAIVHVTGMAILYIFILNFSFIDLITIFLDSEFELEMCILLVLVSFESEKVQRKFVLEYLHLPRLITLTLA